MYPRVSLGSRYVRDSNQQRKQCTEYFRWEMVGLQVWREAGAWGSNAVISEVVAWQAHLELDPYPRPLSLTSHLTHAIHDVQFLFGVM